MNPESLGFSKTRLARIGAWYQARVDAGEVNGAVVVIARGDDVAYLKAIGFQDRAENHSHEAGFDLLDRVDDEADYQRRRHDPGRRGQLELDAPVAQYLPELKDMQVGVEENRSRDWKGGDQTRSGGASYDGARPSAPHVRPSLPTAIHRLTDLQGLSTGTFQRREYLGRIRRQPCGFATGASTREGLGIQLGGRRAGARRRGRV